MYKFIRKPISFILSIIVFLSMIFPVEYVQAQSVLNLPQVGTMISITPAFTPAIMKGMVIYPENPLKFDFIVDPGDDDLQGEELKTEADKLIKYFMASLTVPEKEMWVNLSPYEKDRIMADGLSQTDLGRDLLAQDYILKQLTSSLLYPEKELGKEFWNQVYAKAQERYGSVDIPTETFNKIWIVPEKANVYVKENNVFVVDHYLKVMMEEDYLAISHQLSATRKSSESRNLEADNLSTEVMKSIIIPAIEKEVNEGEHFTLLRQIFNSMILATWYKQNLKQSILTKIYANQNKVEGINFEDKQIKEKIYQQYVDSFKQGVYDYIKEDVDKTTQEKIPRHYFSGGVAADKLEVGEINLDNAILINGDELVVTVQNKRVDAAMSSQERDDVKSGDVGLVHQIPFVEYSKSPSVDYPWALARDIILPEMRRAILENDYDLRGPLNPEEGYRWSYSPAWLEMYTVLQHVVKNLAQHEYGDENLFSRIFPTKVPYEGIRMEFWGPAKVDLPTRLKEQDWFSVVDRPWVGQAPWNQRSLSTTRVGNGVREMFDALKVVEKEWGVLEDGPHILVGWRDDMNNEGPKPNGHIMTLQFPVFNKNEKKDMGGVRDEAMIGGEQNRITHDFIIRRSYEYPGKPKVSLLDALKHFHFLDQQGIEIADETFLSSLREMFYVSMNAGITDDQMFKRYDGQLVRLRQLKRRHEVYNSFILKRLPRKSDVQRWGQQKSEVALAQSRAEGNVFVWHGEAERAVNPISGELGEMNDLFADMHNHPKIRIPFPSYYHQEDNDGNINEWGDILKTGAEIRGIVAGEGVFLFDSRELNRNASQRMEKFRRLFDNIVSIYFKAEEGQQSAKDFFSREDVVALLEKFQKVGMITKYYDYGDNWNSLDDIFQDFKASIQGLLVKSSADSTNSFGGIDLNAQNLDLQTSGDMVQFTIPDKLRNVDSAQITGFIPVIINIQPITNFQQFLGFGGDGWDNRELLEVGLNEYFIKVDQYSIV